MACDVSIVNTSIVDGEEDVVTPSNPIICFPTLLTETRSSQTSGNKNDKISFLSHFCVQPDGKKREMKKVWGHIEQPEDDHRILGLILFWSRSFLLERVTLQLFRV